VASAVVVERDPAEDVAAGVGLGCPAVVLDVEFTFEGGEERFGEGVVIRRADPAHRAAYIVLSADGGEAGAAVLAAAIAMEDHAVDPATAGAYSGIERVDGLADGRRFPTRPVRFKPFWRAVVLGWRLAFRDGLVSRATDSMSGDQPIWHDAKKRQPGVRRCGSIGQRPVAVHIDEGLR